MDQTRETAAKNFGFLVYQPVGKAVAVPCGREDALAFDGGTITAKRRLAALQGLPPGTKLKRRSGSIGLETAIVAAGAKGSVRHHRHVADMACHALAAANHAPVGDDPAADPCANGDIDQIVEPLTGSELPLADRRGDPVVLQADWKRKELLRLRLQRKVGKARKGRNIRRDPGGRIGRTGVEMPTAATDSGSVLENSRSTSPRI